MQTVHDDPLTNTGGDECFDRDAPKESSAASCIRFSLLGQNFAPEYTHQIFPGEFIPGYQPAVLTTDALIHTSFQHPTTHELSINIRLSPSCRSCDVSIDVRPKKRELAQLSLSCIKRPKQAGDTDKESIEFRRPDCITQVDTEAGDVMDSCDASSLVGVGNQVTELRNENRDARMSVEDIQERLQRFLPFVCISNGEPSDESSYLSSPLGAVIAEYSRKGADFCLSLCEGKDCVDYHSAIQKLALFFIETADNVDVSDPAWKILYLFRKHAADKYSLAGYMTLFNFCSPFRKPVGGTIVRVCQALVLPPYQRAGHGKSMLHSVFDRASGTCNSTIVSSARGEDIVEINVEDPAPAFAILRIVVDLERFLSCGRSWFVGIEKLSVTDASFFASLKDSEAIRVTAVARTTAKQVQIIYELHKLLQLRQSAESTALELKKRFRLMVKQRLSKQHREELSACQDKQVMHALLGKMFNETFRQHQVILHAVKL